MCMSSCGNSGKSDDLNNSQSSKSAGLNLSDGFFFPFALTTKSANEKPLKRGVYELEGYFENENGTAQTIKNEEITVPFEGEEKRVFVDKMQVFKPETVDGKKLSKFKAIIEIKDNPLPIPFIVYSLGTVASLGTGFFFVDKLQKFTTTGIGAILSGIVAIFAIWKFLK